MRRLGATLVGVDTQRLAKDKVACTRCGIVRTFNETRRNKAGQVLVQDRRTYKCRDCLHVEADLERGIDP